jgi:hypothetical protein
MRERDRKGRREREGESKREKFEKNKDSKTNARRIFALRRK